MSSRSSKKRRTPERRSSPPATLDLEGERLVVIGELAGAHGVRGEAKLRLYNPDSRTPADVTELYLLGDRWRAKRQARRHGPGWLVCLEGFDTPEAVRACTGTAVAVRERDLAPTADAEYYHYQLLGLEVRDEAGTIRGRVREVIPSPAHDVLAIEADGREHLIPFVDEFVKVVDVPAGRIVVHAPAGLFDES